MKVSEKEKNKNGKKLRFWKRGVLTNPAAQRNFVVFFLIFLCFALQRACR